MRKLSLFMTVLLLCTMLSACQTPTDTASATTASSTTLSSSTTTLNETDDSQAPSATTTVSADTSSLSTTTTKADATKTNPTKTNLTKTNPTKTNTPTTATRHEGNNSVAEHQHTIVTDAAVAATCSHTGLTEGSHCAVCNQVIVAQQTTPKIDHQYSYVMDTKKHTKVCAVCQKQTTEAHALTADGKRCTACPYTKETPPNLNVGTYASQKTYLETAYVLYEIDPNIYIPHNLATMTDEVCRAMEAVTGLSFNNAQYGGKKILVRVCREGIPRPDSEMSAGSSFAMSGATSSSRGDACMHQIDLTSPCSLFTGDSSTLLHELAHTLRYSNSPADFGAVLEEGFADYTLVKTIEYLEKKKSAAGFYLGTSIIAQQSFDLMGFDYSAKNLLGWLSTETKELGGSQYPFGCYLMAYLDATYGNYINWIARHTGDGTVTPQAEYQSLQTVYGQTFDNGFYAWIKANPRTGEATDHLFDPNSQNVLDLTGYSMLSMYPRFSNYGRFRCVLAAHSFTYKDLYISLETAKHYLKSYKNRNIDNLQLTLSHDVTVQYFDKNGVMIKQSSERVVDVTDVSYIKLVGSGYLGRIDLLGYYPETMPYTDGQVLFSGVVDDSSDGRNEMLTTAVVGETFEFAWDTELSYSNAYTLVLKLSDSCCTVTTYDRGWNKAVIHNQTEIVISDLRYFAVYNSSNSPVTAKIIIKKGKR